MDPETIARNLEERARRLSRENNPHNLGIDEVVYSIAQFVRISDRSSKAAESSSAPFNHICQPDLLQFP
jgi:hypothetical protein